MQYLPFSSHGLIYRLGVVFIAVLTWSTYWILPITCLLKLRWLLTALLQRLPPWHAVVVYFAYIFSLSVLLTNARYNLNEVYGGKRGRVEM